MIFTVVVLVLLIPILAIVLDSRLGKAIAARIERRNFAGGDRAAHERLAFLEGEVERLGREVERLDEAGRFTQKLLADRQGPDGLLPGSGTPRRRRPGNEPGA